MKVKKRRLRPEIRSFLNKAEMFTCIAFWVYIFIRSFLFAMGIDL